MTMTRAIFTPQDDYNPIPVNEHTMPDPWMVEKAREALRRDNPQERTQSGVLPR